ncbi:hypothetical protein ACFLU5_00535 [Bacteroidota bacterium]
MKILIYILIGGLFTMATCNLFEDLRTVNLTQTFSHTEDISISEMDPLTINEEFTVNATSNSKIDQYRDKIKSYTVEKISYQILNYVGAPGITMTGTIEFGAVSASISSLDLSDNTVTDLGFDPADLAEVAQELEDGNDVTGAIVGSVSDTPVDFTLKLIFDVAFEAEVLE